MWLAEGIPCLAIFCLRYTTELDKSIPGGGQHILVKQGKVSENRNPY